MKKWDDLTTKEIAELSREEVQKYIEIELMVQGIENPKPPYYEDEPDSTLEKKDKYFQVGSLLFKTAEEANAVLNLNPYKEDYIYAVSYNHKFAVPLDNKDIQQVFFYRQEDIQSQKENIKLSEKVKSSNNQKKYAYDNALNAVAKIENPMLLSWEQAKDRKLFLSKIRDTFEDYKKLCNGDAGLALSFLHKVYSADEIQEANSDE